MSLDALVQSLVSPVASRRMPFRFPLRRRPASVRGLTVAELLDAATRYPGSAQVIWATVGLIPMPETTTSDDQRALFELVCLAVGADTPVAVVRLLRLDETKLTTLLRAIVDLTVPQDTDELLEPVDSPAPRKGNEDLDDGVTSEPSVVLAKIALQLRARGFGDAFDWTPGRLLFVQSVLGEQERHRIRRDLVNTAFAGRLAQATKEGWKAGMAELGA